MLPVSMQSAVDRKRDDDRVEIGLESVAQAGDQSSRQACRSGEKSTQGM